MAYKTSFEQFIDEWNAKARPVRGGETPTRCESCGGPDPITRDGICRECLRYHHGYEEAEEALVNAMVGGAVAGALDAYVSPELITVAVHRAIRKHSDRDADAAINTYARIVAGRES